MNSNVTRKLAGLIAVLMIYLQGCGVAAKTENIKYADIYENEVNSVDAGLIAGEEMYEESIGSNLTESRDKLENSIMIYDFLNQKGLGYMDGKPSLLSADTRKHIDIYNLEGIEFLYYELEKTNDPFLERELIYAYNKAFKIVKDGLLTARNALCREVKIKIADEIIENYDENFDGERINNWNLDTIVEIGRDSSGIAQHYVVFILDGSTNEKKPYYVNKGDNTLYPAIDAIRKADLVLSGKDKIETKEYFKMVRDIFRAAKMLGVSEVYSSNGVIYTDSNGTAKNNIMKNYTNGY